ncbi:MAG TPA: DUF1853 family protein [Telluria sp.]
MDSPPDNYQARFARAWSSLSNPHVRTLAWLLDSPGLLDPAHPHWKGRIATLPAPDAALRDWLFALDADPAPLLAALGDKNYTRLGLYAEKLIAFHFQEQGRLVAHGLQVRAAHNDTVGEFDFLLDAGGGKALHIEFATKFYLLEGVWPDQLDSLVGPNLADSLGQKMRKITSKQLALGSHPAAQAVLPRPVENAQALVKGWLFYPRGTVSGLEGLDPQHCRGTWCSAAELDELEGDWFIPLARLEWLAPARTDDSAQVLSRSALAERVADHFSGPAMPMLVASVREDGGAWTECERAFVVPGDWRGRAATRRVG